MESQFDLVLTLVPIALLIFLRLYASRKKKADDAERTKLDSFLAKAASSGPVKPVVPREVEFDAHSLVADEDEDEDDFKAAAKFLGRTAQPYADVKPNAVQRLVPDVQAPIMGEPPTRDAPLKTEKPAAFATHPADRFMARLDRLSPLKRAVVMAEILGTPKGMQ